MKTKILNVILVIGVLTSLVACKAKAKATATVTPTPEDKGQSEFKAGVLDGTINGTAWTFMSGRVKKDQLATNTGGDRYYLELWETSEADPCNVFISKSNRKIISSIPLKVGTINLDNMTNVTMAYQANGVSENMVATSGRFAIDEIGNGVVKGRLVAAYDTNNSVNGTFTLSLCQ